MPDISKTDELGKIIAEIAELSKKAKLEIFDASVHIMKAMRFVYQANIKNTPSEYLAEYERDGEDPGIDSIYRNLQHIDDLLTSLSREMEFLYSVYTNGKRINVGDRGWKKKSKIITI